MSTFIVFGNSPRKFPRLVEAIKQTYSIYPNPIIIQAGSNLTEFSGYKEFRVFEHVDFSEFNTILQNCSLVISHAGVGVTIQAINECKTPLIMPRRSKFNEHVDDHQVEWKGLLEDHGIAVSFESHEELIISLKKKLFLKRNIVNISDLTGTSAIKPDLHKYLYSL